MRLDTKDLMELANFKALNQPRVPAGSSHGGEFSSSGGSGRGGGDFKRGDPVNPKILKDAGYKFERNSGMTSDVYKHPTKPKITVDVDSKGKPVKVRSVAGDGLTPKQRPFVRLDKGTQD